MNFEHTFKYETLGINLFKRFTKKPKRRLEKRFAHDLGAVEDRLKLAKNASTHREILHYLSQNDPDKRVRQAVKNNSSLPPTTSSILSIDPSEDIRIVLAKRLVDLLPQASDDQQSQLYAYVVQVLGTLALDEVLKIRKALTSTLQDHACTPPKISRQMARDVERDVSEPILRFCAALSDDDLIDLLQDYPANWINETISSRDDVNKIGNNTILEARQKYDGVNLISNMESNIDRTLLTDIVKKSKQYPEWKRPETLHPILPVSIAKTLAEFVDSSVRDLLLSRGDIDPETVDEITHIFRRRIDLVDQAETNLSIEVHLQTALKEDLLHEDLVYDAIGMKKFDLAFGALAHLSGIHMQKIKAIFDSGSAKSIVAIIWKAGLSMRLALQLQKEAIHLAPRDLIYPRGGNDYPLSDNNLQEHLSVLSL